MLDHAIGYYGVCQEVEAVVRAEPSGPGGLDGFLEAMNRLYNAQRYFQKNNPSSVELQNVTGLFSIGLESLYAEFHDILNRQSRPILPIVLLDLIGSDEDTSNEDAPQSLCQLPESVMSDLLKIAGWLEERGHRRHTKMYASVRSAIVLRSLLLLKEHQRSASGGSTHGGSPMPVNKPYVEICSLDIIYANTDIICSVRNSLTDTLWMAKRTQGVKRRGGCSTPWTRPTECC